MSKAEGSNELEMRDEYDFAGGSRGKYADRFKAGSKLVVLDPDVAAEFPDAESVNKALRVVLERKKSRDGAA